MRLKTLKDFRAPKEDESPYIGEWAIGVNQTCDKLRKEAIKWIKNEEIIAERQRVDYDSATKEKWASYQSHCYAIHLLKRFFNITEKDLS